MNFTLVFFQSLIPTLVLIALGWWVAGKVIKYMAPEEDRDTMYTYRKQVAIVLVVLVS